MVQLWRNPCLHSRGCGHRVGHLGREVRQQPVAHGDVNTGRVHQEGGGFLSAGRVPRLEPSQLLDGVSGGQAFRLLHLVQMPDGQLQDVGLLQLGHVLTLSLESRGHDVLQLVQTLVDPGAPFSLQKRLHDLEE